MNIKRISFSLLLVAALSLSAFAACGNGVPDQGENGGRTTGKAELTPAGISGARDNIRFSEDGDIY